MRRDADADRVRAFVRELARRTSIPARVYLVGGTSAVIEGWRATTLDIDVRIEPEDDALLRELPRLKQLLDVNVELASPLDFLPALPGWQDRSPFLFRERQIDVFHFDFYAQALAKLERGFDQDRTDVRAMMDAGHVERTRLLDLYDRVEDALFRFPSVDPGALRSAIAALE
ncbi:MAG: hypothetical protein H0V81_02410 [Solirubrobacterales bacterium]|nr:hypothetical protein [Solirubrobacterales bacterium]